MASVAGQSLVSVKSVASVPLTPMLPMWRGPPPVSVSDTVSGELAVPTVSEPKFSPLGWRLTCGSERPLPLSATVCGLSGASSPIASVAVFAPAL